MLEENYRNVIKEIHMWGPSQDKRLVFLKTTKNSKKKRKRLR